MLRTASAACSSVLFLLGYYLWSASGFQTAQHAGSNTRLVLIAPLLVQNNREAEIRRKITQLKREGRLKTDSNNNDEGILEDDGDKNSKASASSARIAEYESRIRKKLGDKKSRMLGIVGGDEVELDDDDNEEEDDDNELVLAFSKLDLPEARLGSIPAPLPIEYETLNEMQPTPTAVDSSTSESMTSLSSSSKSERKRIINPDLFDSDGDRDGDMPEEDLVEMVAERLAEKRALEKAEKERLAAEKTKALLAKLDAERQASAESQSPQQTTTGIGGSYSQNKTAQVDLYQPKVGSWGAFPRPRDISKAYGGGRRVGPGSTDQQELEKSIEETRAKLQRYREKVGIDVQSERDYATEINEALAISSRSMQRGMYNNAVSALEKVTKYCSTNSELGGKVFLELAMAYEAAGRTDEAIAVYKELTESRIERIKINAKKLLYGIEAINFMRNDLKASEFSRKAAKATFIDTTGLANFASNFDDVYNTAYVDLEGGFYKKISENAVRSHREARQILMSATNSGEISRVRIVQALRSISRRFDEALQVEISLNEPAPEPVALINGKPILPTRNHKPDDFSSGIRADDFMLIDADTMFENLDGLWRLQLLADKQGDGVKFFNKTESWQQVDVTDRKFFSSGPQGFIKVEQKGNIEFNKKRRVLRRSQVEVISGGVFTSIFGKTSGALGAMRAPQQIMSVDSNLLVTRGVPSRIARQKDDAKDYFAVWRRVERVDSQR